MGGAMEGGRGQVRGLGSPGWGPGSGLERGAGRCCLTVSKSVCALHRPCLHRRQKRGQGVPRGGLAWWGRGLKLEGEVKEGQGLTEGEGVVRLYIIYRDTESVHAAGTPVPTPRHPVHCPPPQGCPLVNLDSVHTTVLGAGVGGGGRAYCCKQGEGAVGAATPSAI